MDENTAAPDPQSSTTPQEFVAEMCRLRAWSGLSLRQVARRAAAAGEVLPHSTLAEVLGRGRLPREDLVIAFVRACGSPPEAIEDWVAARRRLAVAAIPGREDSDDRPGETTPDPDPVTPPKPVPLVREEPSPVVRDRPSPVVREEPRLRKGAVSMAIRLGACGAAVLTLAATSTGPADKAMTLSPLSAGIPRLTDPKGGAVPLRVRGPFRIRVAHSKLCLSEQPATGGRIHQIVCRLAYPSMTLKPSSKGA